MVYAPLELFFTNRREFWFDFIDMLPQLLTGQWYENDGSYEDYITSSFKTSALFRTLQENQYKMGIYDPDIALDYAQFNGMFCNTFAQQYGFSLCGISGAAC